LGLIKVQPNLKCKKINTKAQLVYFLRRGGEGEVCDVEIIRRAAGEFFVRI